MTVSRLGGAVLASALLAIAAAIGELPASALFVFKPLTTLLIIAMVWRGDAASPARHWVLAGLALSLAGDVALLWPREGFLTGLVSFLLAHLAYIVAFTRVAPFAARRGPFAVYTLVAGGILALLWPGVPAGLRAPVVVYVVCLATMASQAAVVWQVAPPEDKAHAAVLAVGGALFVASDSLLAINKFGGGIALSGLWILATYWAAQWCIARWVGPPR